MGQTAADLPLHLVSRKRDHADIVSIGGHLDHPQTWPMRLHRTKGPMRPSCRAL